MAHSTHTFPLLKASFNLCSVLCLSSTSRLCASSVFSSVVSHFASLMLLSKKKITIIPTRTEGMPSDRKSHCQPASPIAPESLSIIHPEIGFPITPETAIAATNHAVRVDRSRDGYHKVR